jgi:GT2 family glycosyltransferase
MEVPPRTLTVSVVIVCRNSGDYLPRCLEALDKQEYRDFEIVVVDNASTDDSTRDLPSKWPRLRLRVERLQSNIGFAAGCNLGARVSSGEWLVMLNPDAFPEPDWLRQLMQAAGELPNAFFASRQIQVNRPRLLDGDGDIYFTSGLAIRRNYNVPHYPPGPPKEVFSACAAAAMYPRQAFDDAGGFDEDYFAYHEDVDLGFRLRLRGLRCWLVPAAIVHHIGLASSGPRSEFSTYHGHRNLVWTYFKDMPTPWLWIYLPLHLIWGLLTVGYFTVRGQGRVILRAKVDAVRGLPEVLRKRRKVQAERRTRLSQLLRVMNQNPLGPLEGIIDRTWPDQR